MILYELDQTNLNLVLIEAMILLISGIEYYKLIKGHYVSFTKIYCV